MRPFTKTMIYPAIIVEKHPPNILTKKQTRCAPSALVSGIERRLTMTEISVLNNYQKELAEEFQPQEIKFKPEVTKKTVNGQKVDIKNNQGEQIAGCTAHIDARDVMNRLDAVVGIGGWSDSYQVLNDGKNVECTLTVLGVSKSDVGQTNEGGFADPLKAAYSDALKRAAVKFGIARHLYGMEMQWKLFDGYKIIEKPTKKAAVLDTEPEPVPKQTTNGNTKTGHNDTKKAKHDLSVPDLETVNTWRNRVKSTNMQQVMTVATAAAIAFPYFDNAWHVLEYCGDYKDDPKQKVDSDAALELWDALEVAQDKARKEVA